MKLGTKSCGFARQFLYEFNEDAERVSSFVFSTKSHWRIDFPSALILSREGNAEEFGIQAIEQFKGIGDYNEDCVFFENIIESLYISEDFDDKTLIKDSRGSKHKALDIFGKFLRILFDYACHDMSECFKLGALKLSEIKWMLMIPSVRAGSGVQAFFEKAWNEVFRNDTCTRENLVIVAFPDAALTYYLYLPPEQCNGICIDKIRTGERVMIIGFEDELDSFNIYEKKENWEFKQVVNFLSGASSKCLMMKAFDSFFEDLIGSWLWKVGKENCDDLWPDIVTNIDLLNESKMDKECMVTLSSRFCCLNEICDKHTNMTVKQILEKSKFASSIRLRRYTLRVKSSLIKTLIDKCLSKIINNIEHVLPKSDKEVTTLILAGDMARSGLLIHAVQTAFPSKQIVVSDTANEAALRGAVLFGHQPIAVSSICSGAQVIVAR
ncbi:unnamed protein product [Mytilus coruscus]|uniref:Uncharacterized protein n=1 Tax=Mytilus coruscus TaxID=42192 RepID=A0A6J8D2V6_MYTCO|nr:unnamed protein product [Mytilus coruscus]